MTRITRFETAQWAWLETPYGPRKVRVYGRAWHLGVLRFVVDDPFLPGVRVFADENELEEAEAGDA